jgi:restriction system protein
LLIVNEVESRPPGEIARELEVVRRRHPNARVVLTSRAAPLGGGTDLQLALSGLSQAEFHELLRRRLAYAGSEQLADELYSSLEGHPLAARLATDLIRAGGLTPRELLERLRAFSWPGVVGPQGETIPEETPEHRHVVSDVVTVNDEFLRKLHANPHLLHELSPRGIEELVAELLGRLDYEVTLTPASKDGGKDIYAAKKDHLGTFLFIVECKKYAPDHPVGVGLVRQLNGVVQAEQATAGILATTSFFTKGAKEFQRLVSYQISLKDYLGIQDWLEAVLKRRAAEPIIERTRDHVRSLPCSPQRASLMIGVRGPIDTVTPIRRMPLQIGWFLCTLCP